MNHRMLLSPAVLLVGGALLLSSCSSESQSAAQSGASVGTSSAASLPPDLFASEPFDDAPGLLAIKEWAQPGEGVTFAGVIAGRVEPFADGRAVMLVADSALPFCTDGCRAPWDACCAPPAMRLSHTATVQVVDAEGMPLASGLKGQGGLAAGAPIQVRGTIGQAGDGMLVVNAERIHVVQ